MQEFNIRRNTGVIVEKPRELDWIAGVESGIGFAEVNPSGNWGPYLPSDERQSGRLFDTMACVSFSACNVIETQINFLIATGAVTGDILAWLRDNGYLDAAGKVNFSDRYVAKLSGTTRNGNSLVRVADAIREFGLVPEKDWAYDRDAFDWDAYYAEVPQSLKDKGAEFKKRFLVAYEWVPNNPITPATNDALAKHLKQSPIQLAAAVCPPWHTTELIAACGLNVSHATMVYAFDPGRFIGAFDHYIPCRKTLAHDYAIPWLLKIVTTVKAAPVVPAPAPAPVKHRFEKDMRIGDRNKDVEALQKVLELAGYFKINPTGYYGLISARAVLAFQTAYAVESPMVLRQLGGRVVGPRTRAALNALYGG